MHLFTDHHRYLVGQLWVDRTDAEVETLLVIEADPHEIDVILVRTPGTTLLALYGNDLWRAVATGTRDELIHRLREHPQTLLPREFELEVYRALSDTFTALQGLKK